MTNKERIEDLLIEFDELDMQPMLLVPAPIDRAKAWKHELIYAIRHLESEVAREMIQDIASECTLKKDACCNSLEFDIGYLAAMNEVLLHLAKLKQKYTEGK